MPNRITSMFMVKLEVHLDYLHVSLQICRSETHFIRSMVKAKQNACKGSYDGHLLLEEQSRVIFERFGSVGGIKCEQIRNTRKKMSKLVGEVVQRVLWLATKPGACIMVEENN